MFEALKARIRQIETAHKVLPEAALAIATELRAAAKSRRRAAQRGRAKRRAELKEKGYSAATIRLMVTMPKRRGSGISIDCDPSPDELRITASNQVQHFARLQSENEDWMQILGDHVRRAAGGRR